MCADLLPNDEPTVLQGPHHRLIDHSDPDRVAIMIMLHEMERAGIDIDERAAEIATKMTRARIRWQKGISPEQLADKAAWRSPKPHVTLDPGIVYYILRQNLIKIGVTSRPLQRFKDLMPDAILAVEPGNEDVERKRHEQFKELRFKRGEYFYAAPVLVQHIRALRDEHGVPEYEFRSLLSAEESRALVAKLLDS